MTVRCSVVMAAWNGASHIKEQIDSILKQLTESDELIISIDPSSDRTWPIAKSYTDHRVKVIHGPGRGLIKNFENALNAALGDYIFLADQDDIWEDQKVQAMVKELQQGALLVMHDCTILSPGSEQDGASYMKLHHSRQGFWRNIIRNSFIGCCMAFRRELLKVILPFPPNIPMHDQWIGLAACKTGNVTFVPVSYMKYRRHEGNCSQLYHASLRQMILWRADLLLSLIERKLL